MNIYLDGVTKLSINILIIILTAVVIDVVIGEPPSKIHPVVLIGRMINNLRKIFYKNNRMSGLIITSVVLIFFLSISAVLIMVSAFNYFLYLLVSALLLSTMFAIKSLLESVMLVKNDLNTDIGKAQRSMSYLVSRDTSKLSETELISAAIETLTENITDSVIAPLIYTFIFGVLGAVFYRIVNTLDAMVGYKDPENINIGWFPAKLDDILNYIPARITGFLVVIASLLLKMDWKNAYRVMIRDAKKTPSPNSGYPMAAAAGALGVQLVKPGYYQLGDEVNHLKTETLNETILLTKITILLFLVISTILFATTIFIINVF
jgi:adenosylcobinamide-phosphate synthase